MFKHKLGPGAIKTIKKVISIQLIVTLLATAASFVFVDAKAAYSSAVGGVISIVATLYFASQVFSVGIGAPATKIARAFYIGEAIKIVLSMVLFGIAIVWLDVSFLPLLLTYAATLLAYWLALPFTLDTSGRML